MASARFGGPAPFFLSGSRLIPPGSHLTGGPPPRAPRVHCACTARTVLAATIFVMQTKAKTVAVAMAIAVGGIGVGAGVAVAATSSGSTALQPSGQYVFACVSNQGKVDYLEFRKPLPHQCTHSGDTLWHWLAIAPSPSASPSPSPSASPSASSSAPASPSPSSSPSASPSPSASESSDPAPDVSGSPG